MEEAFENLKAQANIIDENITEDKINKELAKADAKNVDLKSFKNALNNLAKESKKNVDELYGKLCSSAHTNLYQTGVTRLNLKALSSPQQLQTVMKEAFDKMQKEGRNSVDHLVKWLQDSKLIDNAKDAEQKARQLFDGAKDKAHVELSQLKDAVSKLADEQAKNAAEAAKSLAAQGPKLMGAFNAASTAFKDAMSKK